jgi:hypothetical protein
MMSGVFHLFESAANHPASIAHDQFTAALRWVEEARRFQHPSIVRAYSTSLTRLDQRISMSPTIQSWQKSLSAVQMSLASDAAASAIEAGHLYTAVELLEQGGAILWSKMQGFRHPLDKLRDVNRDLADEFDRTSRGLEHHAMSLDIESPPPGYYDERSKTHHTPSER